MPNGPHGNQEFIRCFNQIAVHRHRYELFRDFVTMSAISLHNAVNKRDDLEQEYLQIVARYEKEDVDAICKLFAEIVIMMDEEPRDVLGPLYMELELGNDQTGQFFTPQPVSEMMAMINYDDSLRNLDKPFVTLSEPACGAGGMVLAFAKVMMKHGHNPAQRLWVQCVDVDRVTALMCYLQLSLWHIPAQIIVGNSLSLEVREVFYTPAHYLGAWDARLAARDAAQMIAESDTSPVPTSTEQEPELAEPKSATDGSQFDFGF